MTPIALNEVCRICLERFTLVIDREDKDLLVIPLEKLSEVRYHHRNHTRLNYIYPILAFFFPRFYEPSIPKQLDYIVLWYRDDRLRLRRLTLKNVHISLRTNPNMRRLLQSISPGGPKVYRMD